MSTETEETLWLASFDIGKRNFSFYIEEVKLDTLHKIKDVPKKSRYIPCGSPTPEFQLVLNEVCGSGHKVLLENKDLTKNTDSSKYLDTDVMHNLTELLDSYHEYWDQCDVIIIEKQMSFGRRHNTMALKIGQHCWSYFAIKYGRSKEIDEFPAYHKTQVLGAAKLLSKTKTGKVRYKAMGKPARKKWCIQKALSILSLREDFETATSIKSTRKKDDLCDVLCQLQAYKYLRYVMLER